MNGETLRDLGSLSQRDLEDQYVDFIETRNRQQAMIAEIRRVENSAVLSGKECDRKQAEEEAAMWEAVRAGRERD